MNAIQKLSSYELILIIHGYDECVKSRFAFTRTVEIKGLCLQLKRYGIEYAAQKINFLRSTVTVFSVSMYCNGKYDGLFEFFEGSCGAREG